MSCDDADSSGVQRFEVFTGSGRRREWAPEAKAAIVAESYAGPETVCSVARRHGLSPSQLFTWRRQVRHELKAQGIGPSAKRGIGLPVVPIEAPAFVPAVIELVGRSDAAPSRRTRRRRRSRAAVELEINGVAVKIGREADAMLIAAMIEALKS